jgi:hypothetical protein
MLRNPHHVVTETLVCHIVTVVLGVIAFMTVPVHSMSA